MRPGQPTKLEGDAPSAEAESTNALGITEQRSTDIDAMFAANAPGLLHKAMEMAYGGNVSVLRFCLSEALARGQRRASEFQLTAPLDSVEGLAKNSEAVIAAHCAGKLTFEQAAGIQALLSSHLNMLSKASSGPGTGDGSSSPSTATAADFLEPMLALQKTIGFRSKVLDVLERNATPASKE